MKSDLISLIRNVEDDLLHVNKSLRCNYGGMLQLRMETGFPDGKHDFSGYDESHFIKALSLYEAIYLRDISQHDKKFSL